MQRAINVGRRDASMCLLHCDTAQSKINGPTDVGASAAMGPWVAKQKDPLKLFRKVILATVAVGRLLVQWHVSLSDNVVCSTCNFSLPRANIFGPAAPEYCGGAPLLRGLSRATANRIYFEGGRANRVCQENGFDLPWGREDEYEIGHKLGSGYYSSVFAAHHMPTGTSRVVKMLREIEPHRVVREIEITLAMQKHPNSITMLDAFLTADRRVALVFEPVLHAVPNLDLIRTLSASDMRHYVATLLHVLTFARERGIMHRDLDSTNILVDGANRKLIVIDWGLSDWHDSRRRQTVDVAAHGYRAPELILHYESYDYAIDMWSVGAILADWMLELEDWPFFYAENNKEQLKLMAKVLGTEGFHKLLRKYWLYVPPEVVIEIGTSKPTFLSRMSASIGSHKQLVSPEAIDLLSRMWTWDPKERLQASDALMHSFFLMGDYFTKNTTCALEVPHLRPIKT
jgi:casein kinase II subunit alpha